MILKYTVAHGVYDKSLASVQHRTTLEDEVNRMIAEGWQPFGSLVVSQKGETVVFLQPMVLADTDSDDTE